MTLPFSSTTDPPWAPEQPVGEGIGVADRVSEGKARGMVVLLQRLAQFQKPSSILRHGVEAGFLDREGAINRRTAGAAERDAIQLLVPNFLPSRSATGYQPAVFLAEIFGDVGEFDQLVGVEMRIVGPADDDIGANSRIGAHRRLRAQVFPGLVIDTHRHAGLRREGLGVLVEDGLVRGHELGGTQHAERRAFSDRKIGSGDVGFGIAARAPPKPDDARSAAAPSCRLRRRER